MMKVKTIRSQIRELPDRLREGWQRPDGSWARIVQHEPDTEVIHARVSALNPETATVDDVHAAMSFSGGWIEEPKCNECGALVEMTVQLGEEPDYDSHTADVCVGYLKKALALCEGAAL